MGRPLTVSDSIVIAANRHDLYAAVSDPRQMRRWSPENRGARLDDETHPLGVGATFVGDNERGLLRWSTRCTVTKAEPGKRFAFTVDALRFGRAPFVPIPIAAWEFRFDPTASGTTRVTEIWTDRRTYAPDFVTRFFDPIATRRPSFAEYQQENIARTLARLRDDFEASGP